MVDLLTSVTTATSCLSRWSLSLLLWYQAPFGTFWSDSHRISFCLLHCSVWQFPCKYYENWQYGPDAKDKGLIQIHLFLFWKLLQFTLRWQGGNDVLQKNAFLIILISKCSNRLHPQSQAWQMMHQDQGPFSSRRWGWRWAWGHRMSLRSVQDNSTAVASPEHSVMALGGLKQGHVSIF